MRPGAVGWSAEERLTAAEAAKSSVCGTEDSGPFRQCGAASRCSSIGLSPMRLLAVRVSCAVTVCHGLQPTWIRPHPPELGSPPLQEHGGHTHGSVAGPCGSVARTHPFGCHPASSSPPSRGRSRLAGPRFCRRVWPITALCGKASLSPGGGYCRPTNTDQTRFLRSERIKPP